MRKYVDWSFVRRFYWISSDSSDDDDNIYIYLINVISDIARVSLLFSNKRKQREDDDDTIEAEVEKRGERE